ncbi:hypothetical protein [Nostoc sp. FACHB-888]|uniref:hypothetical protein n=1 Tax=Nostoc sp. FACHB-888 TaxID=2692842 RepID=UPI0016862704|nr:hypothetical protein [Nostoc sp. FACHB-888]
MNILVPRGRSNVSRSLCSSIGVPHSQWYTLRLTVELNSFTLTTIAQHPQQGSVRIAQMTQ